MSSASGVLMRRSVELASSHLRPSDAKPDQPDQAEPPLVLVALSILTVFAMVLVMWAVSFSPVACCVKPSTMILMMNV